MPMDVLVQTLRRRYSDCLRSILLSSIVALAWLPAPVAANFTCDNLAFNVKTANTKKRPLESIKTLRIATYNVLNLFESVGRFEAPNDAAAPVKVKPGEVKPEWQTKGVAEAIKETNLDIILVQEAESAVAIERLDNQYMGGKYASFAAPTNDSRGITIGLMIKKDLPFRVDFETHVKDTWVNVNNGAEQTVFSRDLPAMLIRAMDAAPNAPPKMIILGGHYKSKRNRANDPESNILRTAQMQRTAEVIKEYQQKFGKDVPVIIGADFNTDVNIALSAKPAGGATPEMAALRAAGILNSFDVPGQPNVPLDSRVTHTYHPDNGPAVKGQLDGILVSASAASALLSTKIYRYKDANGREKPIPDTLAQRDQNPSDHFLLFAEFNFPGLWNRK